LTLIDWLNQMDEDYKETLVDAFLKEGKSNKEIFMLFTILFGWFHWGYMFLNDSILPMRFEMDSGMGIAHLFLTLLNGLVFFVAINLYIFSAFTSAFAIPMEIFRFFMRRTNQN